MSGLLASLGFLKLGWSVILCVRDDFFVGNLFCKSYAIVRYMHIEGCAYIHQILYPYSTVL